MRTTVVILQYHISSKGKTNMNTDKKIIRHNALKYLGATTIGSAATPSGLLSLAACSPMKSKRVILYFTGTSYK